MKNYITLEEAKKQGFDVIGYHLNRLNEDLKRLSIFEPLCKLVPMVYISNYDNKVHFEHITVYIEFKGYLLRPSNYYNKNSYTFYLFNSVICDNFNTNLVEPNKVGKPTEKKLNEWLTYLLEIEKQKSEILEQRNNKETEFLNKINNCGLNVVWYNDKKSGYIYHKDFEYHFSIEKGGYINERLTYRGGQKIDDLLKL